MSELSALKDIIFEASGGRAGQNKNSGRNKRASGLRGLSLAQQFSQLHYQDNEKSSDIDGVFGIKKFTTEIVIARLEEIRDCFEAEKVAIEHEIERLTDSLDGDYGDDGMNESDSKVTKSMSTLSIHTAPVPVERLELCSVCNTKRPASQIIPSASKSATGMVCTSCETTRNRREAKMGSVLATSSSQAQNAHNNLSYSRSTPMGLVASTEDLHLSSPPVRSARHNNNEDSPDSARIVSPRGATSKFRNRIDSARHEHHFIDEF